MKPRIYQLFVVCRNEIVNLSLSCEGAFHRGNCLRKFSQREGDYFFNGCGRGGGVNPGFAYFIGRKSEILCYQYRTFYISSSPCGQSRLSSSKIPLSSDLCALVFDSCFVISSLEEARVNLMAL